MPHAYGLKYRAFISYSHDDAGWSRMLLRRLEAYPIPAEFVGRAMPSGVVPSSLRPIFRDIDEAAAGSALTPAIIAALDDSAALVVVCSPSAASSEWVNREVELFRSRHPDRPILPVIIAGNRGDPKQECFPPALRPEARTRPGSAGSSGAAEELLAADLRSDEELALAKIVAGMLGLPADEVYARAARERRRRMKFWIAGLSATTAMLLGLFVMAEYHRQRAEQNLAVALDITSSMTFNLTNELRGLRGAKLDEIERILADSRAALARLEPLSFGKWFGAQIRALGAWLIPAARAQDPRIDRNKAGVLVQEATTRAARGDIEGQERLAGEAVTILRRLITLAPNDIELPRELSVALNKLGEARSARGNPTGAATAFRESLGLMEDLQRSAPWSPLFKRDAEVPLIWLGNLALADGRLDEAEAAYRRALSLIDQVLAADLAALGISDRDARAASIDKVSAERERSVALNKLGDVAEARQDTRAALELFRQALDIRRRLFKDNPYDGVLLRQLNVSRANVGRMHFAIGDMEGAAAAFEEAAISWREQVKSDPGNEQHKRDLSIGLNQLGATLLQVGKIAEARAVLAEDLALTHQLVTKDRSNVELKQELVTSLLRLTEASLLPPLEPARACALLTEVEALVKAGTRLVPDASRAQALLTQALATMGLKPGACGN